MHSFTQEHPSSSVIEDKDVEDVLNTSATQGPAASAKKVAALSNEQFSAAVNRVRSVTFESHQASQTRKTAQLLKTDEASKKIAEAKDANEARQIIEEELKSEPFNYMLLKASKKSLELKEQIDTNLYKDISRKIKTIETYALENKVPLEQTQDYFIIKDLYEKRQYNDILFLLEKYQADILLLSSPVYFKLIHYLGLSFFEMGVYRNAAIFLKKAAHVCVDQRKILSTDLAYDAALAYERLNNFESAANFYALAIQNTYFDKTGLSLDRGLHAIDILLRQEDKIQQKENKETESLESLITFAREQLKRKHYRAAHEAFSKAIRLDRNNPSLYLERGLCGFHLKNYGFAIFGSIELLIDFDKPGTALIDFHIALWLKKNTNHQDKDRYSLLEYDRHLIKLRIWMGEEVDYENYLCHLYYPKIPSDPAIVLSDIKDYLQTRRDKAWHEFNNENYDYALELYQNVLKDVESFEKMVTTSTAFSSSQTITYQHIKDNGINCEKPYLELALVYTHLEDPQNALKMYDAGIASTKDKELLDKLKKYKERLVKKLNSPILVKDVRSDSKKEKKETASRKAKPTTAQKFKPSPEEAKAKADAAAKAAEFRLGVIKKIDGEKSKAPEEKNTVEKEKVEKNTQRNRNKQKNKRLKHKQQRAACREQEETQELDAPAEATNSADEKSSAATLSLEAGHTQIPKVKLRDIERDILSRLGKGNAYLVGGTLRERLLNRADDPKRDIDIVTTVSKDDILSIFQAEKIYEDKSKPGLFKIMTPEGLKIEIFHSDNLAKSLEAHAKVGDFTVNTLLCDAEEKIHDPLGCGFDDLKKGVLQTVVPPEELFEKNPICVFRAIYLACTSNFALSDPIKSAITKKAHCLLDGRLELSYVNSWLHKMLKHPVKAAENFSTMLRLGVIDILFPTMANEIKSDVSWILDELKAGQRSLNNVYLMLMTSVLKQRKIDNPEALRDLVKENPLLRTNFSYEHYNYVPKYKILLAQREEFYKKPAAPSYPTVFTPSAAANKAAVATAPFSKPPESLASAAISVKQRNN